MGLIKAMPHGGNVHALARRLGVEAQAVLDFSASINPLGPPPTVIEALAGGLDHLLVNYPEPRAETLAAEIAARLGLSEERIVVGNGSTELIHLLPRAVGRRSEAGRALIVAPAFSEYSSALEREGWSVEHFLCRPEDGLAPDMEALKERLAGQDHPGFLLVFLGQPANPTGVLTDPAGLAACARIQERRGGLLIVDEAFIDFAPQYSLAGVLGELPAGIILRSLTKFYALPGLRLGFLAASEEVAARLRNLQPPWSVNALAQAAGRLCLEAKDYAKKTRKTVAAERSRLTRKLEGLGLRVVPSAANYLAGRLGDHHPPADQVMEALARQAILVRDCADFVGLGPGWLRFSVRLAQENERLVKALAEAL